MLSPDEIRKKAESWLGKEFNEETRKEVREMLDKDEKKLIDAFYQDLEFGTGGLRGIMGAGTNRMNIYTLGMATQGLSNYIIKQCGNSGIKVAIAYDCRNNSRYFAETTANIFSANGFEVYLFESLRPTPELSFAIRHYKCHSGVVITASHNPPEYNGYKAYWNDGGQVVAEERLLAGRLDHVQVDVGRVGVPAHDDAHVQIQHLSHAVVHEIDRGE